MSDNWHEFWSLVISAVISIGIGGLLAAVIIYLIF
jgi:hypothetical protein